MSYHVDLESTIADAVNDAQIDTTPETPEVEAAPEVEASPEASSESPAAEEPAAETETPEAESPAVASPAASTTSDEPQDEFAKLAGVPQMGVAGRENRIPYSRVKKITEKAVNDLAEVVLGRKLNAGEKAADVVKSHVARIPELESKVTDYETRLTHVGQFEDVMANDPKRFLGMLSRIPAYKEFFELVDRAMSQLPGTPAAAQPAAQSTTLTPSTPAVDPASDMPEPDEELSDGSKVYSMDGLKRLLAWNSQQAEARISKQFEERYKPIEAEWQERKRIEATLPVIRKQIEEAKQWPLFSENEEEITKALSEDPKISLEGAYRKVVFPKLIAERNKTRQEVIQEIKTAPTSTSVPTRVASKPVAPSSGAKSLEDIIKEQVETIRR